jgi:hypothetical protein
MVCRTTSHCIACLLMGKHLDYWKQICLEFSAYVQMHEEHSNDMQPQRIGTICLGPSGNEQGGHYFMSLMTGHHLLRAHWTELPMPLDAIVRVGNLGRQQGMPKTLTFADRHGFEIPDDAHDVDDDHDSAYDPAEDDNSSNDNSGSYSSEHDSDSDDDDDRGDVQPLPGLPAGVDGNDNGESKSEDKDESTNHDADDEDDEESEDGNDDNDGDDPGSDTVDMPDDEDEEQEDHQKAQKPVFPKNLKKILKICCLLQNSEHFCLQVLEKS